MLSPPLRRALIVEHPLTFPEGIATAEVLKVGDRGGGIRSLILGSLLGGLFKLAVSGFKIFSGSAHAAMKMGGSAVSIGSELGPALLGVGYIVGLNIGVLVFLGGAINWLVIMKPLRWCIIRSIVVMVGHCKVAFERPRRSGFFIPMAMGNLILANCLCCCR